MTTMTDRPQTRALLAALRSDLAGIRAQLDRLPDDELILLLHAAEDVRVEIRFTLADRGCETSQIRVGDTSRDGSGHPASRRCLACGEPLTSNRARHCKGSACRMRAHRLRQRRDVDVDTVRNDLRNRRELTAHTVYECGACGERYLAERRCSTCNLFCRVLEPGGACSECDHVILLSELLDLP
jgi:hypothetical protein